MNKKHLTRTTTEEWEEEQEDNKPKNRNKFFSIID